MANVVVVGSQWGDEGKGKIVDWLSERADVVVRFSFTTRDDSPAVPAGSVVAFDEFELSRAVAPLPSGADARDIDVDVARVYAKTFSEDELKTIGAFLSSDAGKKYQTEGPKVFAETFDTVQRWSDRVGAELLDKSREELKRQGIEL